MVEYIITIIKINNKKGIGKRNVTYKYFAGPWK